MKCAYFGGTIQTTMEKHSYEAIKGMRDRQAKGTATFAERNILKIIDKKKRNGAKVEAPKSVRP